jgi:hypothetical protein
MNSVLHRLPARVCKIKRIDKIRADLFLDQNHRLGTCSSKIKYGLFLPKNYFRLLQTAPDAEEYLVAVMTFSGKRVMQDGRNSYEMIRFCNLLNFSVLGGLSKLIKHFVADTKADHIMTYIDQTYADGKSYTALGFQKCETPESNAAKHGFNNLKLCLNVA